MGRAAARAYPAVMHAQGHRRTIRRRTRRRRWPLWIGVAAIVVGAVVVAGFMVVPSAPDPLPLPLLERPVAQALPEGLPEPVARFFETRYGSQVEPPTGVVVHGHAWLRPAGPWFLPARFRFVHDAGRSYAHDIAITWFGLDVMRVDERYVDGRARMAIPFAVEEHTPQLAQGAALALWAEAIWFPTLWVTHPGVTWEPVDQATAVLVMPFERGDLRATIGFDEAGDISGLEAQRFAGADAEATSRWRNAAEGWTMIDGSWRPRVGSVRWDDDDPWAVFTVTSVQEHVDVEALLRAPWSR